MDPSALLDVVQANEGLLWLLGGLSLVLFFGSLAAIPWLIARIPADYFLPERRGRPVLLAHRPALRLLARILGNLLGVVLVLAGIAMLVLPGQGLLTIIAGLLLISFPGKYRVERWIVNQPRVHRLVDRLRRRAGRAPLILPEPPGPRTRPTDDG